MTASKAELTRKLRQARRECAQWARIYAETRLALTVAERYHEHLLEVVRQVPGAVRAIIEHYQRKERAN